MVVCFEKSRFTDIEEYKEWRKARKAVERDRLKRCAKRLLSECLFCSSTDNLMFHHVNPNEKEYWVHQGQSKKQILEEAKKCWCLCEDCHIKLHQRLVDPLPSTWTSRISVT